MYKPKAVCLVYCTYQCCNQCAFIWWRKVNYAAKNNKMYIYMACAKWSCIINMFSCYKLASRSNEIRVANSTFILKCIWDASSFLFVVLISQNMQNVWWFWWIFCLWEYFSIIFTTRNLILYDLKKTFITKAKQIKFFLLIEKRSV